VVNAAIARLPGVYLYKLLAEPPNNETVPLYLPAKDRAPHIVLILWRAVCDTAVAIRFLTVTKSNTAYGSLCDVQ
jgi:hypothetical protein